MEQSLEKSFAAKSTQEAARAVSTSLSHGGAAMIKISPVGDWTISRACKISSSKKLEPLRGRGQKGRSAAQGNAKGPVGMGSSVSSLIGVTGRIVARFSSLLLL